MESVVPPPNGKHDKTLEERVEWLEEQVGLGALDGMRGDMASQTKALNTLNVLLMGVDRRLVKAEANRLADKLEAQQQLEAWGALLSAGIYKTRLTLWFAVLVVGTVALLGRLP